MSSSVSHVNVVSPGLYEAKEGDLIVMARWWLQEGDM